MHAACKGPERLNFPAVYIDEANTILPPFESFKVGAVFSTIGGERKGRSVRRPRRMHVRKPIVGQLTHIAFGNVERIQITDSALNAVERNFIAAWRPI